MPIPFEDALESGCHLNFYKFDQGTPTTWFAAWWATDPPAQLSDVRFVDHSGRAVADDDIANMLRSWVIDTRKGTPETG